MLVKDLCVNTKVVILPFSETNTMHQYEHLIESRKKNIEEVRKIMEVVKMIGPSRFKIRFVNEIESFESDLFPSIRLIFSQQNNILQVPKSAKFYYLTCTTSSGVTPCNLRKVEKKIKKLVIKNWPIAILLESLIQKFMQDIDNMQLKVKYYCMDVDSPKTETNKVPKSLFNPDVLSPEDIEELSKEILEKNLSPDPKGSEIRKNNAKKFLNERGFDGTRRSDHAKE